MAKNIQFKQVYSSSGPKFVLKNGEFVKVSEGSPLELTYESHPGQTSAQVLEAFAKEAKESGPAESAVAVAPSRKWNKTIELSFGCTIDDKDGTHYYPFLAVDLKTGKHLTKEEVLAREPDAAALFTLHGL